MKELPLIRAKYTYLDGRSRWGHTRHLADDEGKPLCRAHGAYTHRDRCGWIAAEGEPVCTGCLKVWKLSQVKFS